MTRRAVIFDVDGTLVDSQDDIVASMKAAFAEVDRPAPRRRDILALVGIALDDSIPMLWPEGTAEDHARMVAAYKDAYAGLRKAAEMAGKGANFYPGMRDLLDDLMARDIAVCVATGKSRRGLDALFASAGLRGAFASTQVSDDHPSKPDPSMIRAVLTETGADPSRTVMVGDTTFDVEMAVRAGVAAIGVAWGYHRAAELTAAGAAAVAEDAKDLAILIARQMEGAA